MKTLIKNTLKVAVMATPAVLAVAGSPWAMCFVVPAILVVIHG